LCLNLFGKQSLYWNVGFMAARAIHAESTIAAAVPGRQRGPVPFIE
jgi:hypothetical protein